jgi:hypothetical protein
VALYRKFEFVEMGASRDDRPEGGILFDALLIEREVYTHMCRV